MKVRHYKRETCRLCESEDLGCVLSLEPTPPANAFVNASRIADEQSRFPLDVYFCRACKHVQLLDVVDPEELFGEYVYVSGTSSVFVKHFEDYAQMCRERYNLQKGDFVVEIGSNDGTLLRFFQDAGMRVVGIDPAREIARRATESGIETLPTFFDSTLARKLQEERKSAKLIAANNVFAHIDDLGEVVDGVRSLLTEDGVFVFEVSYLVDVFNKTLFDTIYHEHLAYHSVGPLVPFFEAHGMELIHVSRVGSHGGSLRAVAQLKGGPHLVEASVALFIEEERVLGLQDEDSLKAFAARINDTGEKLRTMLQELKSENRKIAGFGAPAKATTLMYHFGINSDLIDFVVDDSPLKQGLYTPGMHIPVVPASRIPEEKPDYLLLLAWNFADAIIGKHAEFRENGGKFIVPLPNLEVV